MRHDADAAAAVALAAGRFVDPFAYLGPHLDEHGTLVRAFLPGALTVEVLARENGESLGQLALIHPAGLFAGHLSKPASYLFRVEWPHSVQETEDPYSFSPLLGDIDLHL